MVWAQLLESTKFSRPKNIQVLILGKAQHALRPPNVHFLGFDCRSFEEGGEQRAKLTVFAVTEASPELLKPLAGSSSPTCAIICLDWLSDVTSWSSEIDAWIDALSPIEPATIVISAANFHRVQQQMASAAFDDGVETCQAFLRTAALRYNATLVYERPQFDWEGLVGGKPMEPTVVDDVVIPAGWDTKDRILATNPDFDFDRALDGTIELPRLRLPSAVPSLPNLLPAQDIEEMNFGEIIERAAKPVPSGRDTPVLVSTPSSRAQTPEVGDKEALDQFFSYLIDRSK